MVYCPMLILPNILNCGTPMLIINMAFATMGFIFKLSPYDRSHGKKSIQFRGSKLWNDLSEELRNSNSLNIFKKRYKKFLLEDKPQDDDEIYIFY